jgi:hypothetical protein
MSALLPKPVLDLNKVHSRQQLGELTVMLTWCPADDNDFEPCMVLAPTYRALAPSSMKPCVIALSSAWKYNEDAYLWQQARHIANILGLSPSAQYSVAKAINDGLLDLINVPPRPLDQVVVADAIARNERGQTLHAEILEDV